MAEVEAEMIDLAVVWADLFGESVGKLDETKVVYDAYASEAP